MSWSIVSVGAAQDVAREIGDVQEIPQEVKQVVQLFANARMGGMQVECSGHYSGGDGWNSCMLNIRNVSVAKPPEPVLATGEVVSDTKTPVHFSERTDCLS
jgi:hypothetical protein